MKKPPPPIHNRYDLPGQSKMPWRPPRKPSPGWKPLYDPEQQIDWAITPAIFAHHLLSQRPFVHIKAGEGEMRTALGFAMGGGPEHNCFGDMPERMREALVGVVNVTYPSKSCRYVGLHRVWHQELIQPWIVENKLLDRVTWVNQGLLHHGFRDFSLLHFLAMLKKDSRPKYLVGNSLLAPIADGLRATFIEIPLRQCYLKYPAILEDCVSRAALGSMSLAAFSPIWLVCAGMTAEILIWDLLQREPHATYIDCGAVFDPLAGAGRDEIVLRSWGRDPVFQPFLNQYYRPLLEMPPYEPT